ncbi:hypothetical protein [Mycobacterium simiae]|uniref:hypothetical protein n=1 Tax=Mycobacterium simiae TaxID=1784 RepID=UPI0005CB3D7A|nr:hypothetical protein [Mycobacterium simiae]PLV44946.1 hypothetical protein X011_25655 [Mycobacterium tuberculosis variant microti OV254]BBX38927.1 hypothetical protein MSIM_03780 [Mycobacterium simiae]
MTTTIESKDIRMALAWELESQASFREHVAQVYPEDTRNARSANELRLLAEGLRTNAGYDDTPALRKILALVTEHGLPLECIIPSDGFNASQYRFHDANESDDEFLNDLADALESELSELSEVQSEGSDAIEMLAKLVAPAGDHVELGIESKSFNGTAFYVVLTVKNKGIALEPEQARSLAQQLLNMAQAADEGAEDWYLYGAEE